MKKERLTARQRRERALQDKVGQTITNGHDRPYSSYQVKVGHKYDLEKFQLTVNQQAIEDSIYTSSATVVQGESGVGKTSVSVRTALKLLKENNDFTSILFVKNPTESGDDAIGFLTGDKDEKLEKHFEVMRDVFLEFMSKGVLECDEKNGNIKFEIPNYLQGSTFKNTIMILDESQNMSPPTLKMIMERVGEGSILIILGDKKQTYAVNSRKDGFTDFVDRITQLNEVDVDGVVNTFRQSKEPLFNYFELTSQDNKRSELSKRITELYA